MKNTNKPILNGRCNFCKGIFDKSEITRHLKTCKELKNKLDKLSEEKKTEEVNYFQILIEGKYSPEYWLYIEMMDAEELGALDQFLRDIWVECCHHCSQFVIEKKFFIECPDITSGDKKSSMNTKLKDVLKKGTKFTYEYDYGSSTNLNLKVVSERKGKSNKNIVTIMARNEAPVIKCKKCGNSATKICMYCCDGFFCDICFENHGCEEESFLPVVNSPRMGVCGYG